MSRKVNVGLVGYGMAGRVFHAPVISAIPQLQLAAVVERHGEASRQRYPKVAVVKDASALFGSTEIDLVAIATPNPTHFDLARAALLAGKHVVVDKPFTITTAEAQELTDLAQHQKRILSVHQNRRWDGDFLTVSELLRQRRLGRLVAYESRFDRFRRSPRPGAWREEAGAGSGLLYDIGSHLIDQALVLFGPPRSVCADIRMQRDNAKTDDQFEVVLGYDRLKVTCAASMLACEPGPRFTLHGTNWSFVKFGLDPQEEALKRGKTPDDRDWGKDPEEGWGTLSICNGSSEFRGKIETARGCYQAFYQNVYEAIANGAELAVRPEQARDVIRLIELAKQSSAEKRAVDYSSKNPVS
jgi:predicted dehydrogenase